jgi:hypothetical protein
MAPARRTEPDKSENRIARYRRCEPSSPFCRLGGSISVVATAVPPVRSATPRSSHPQDLMCSNSSRSRQGKPHSRQQRQFPERRTRQRSQGVIGLSSRLAEKLRPRSYTFLPMRASAEVAAKREHFARAAAPASTASTQGYRQLHWRHGRPQPGRSQQSGQHAEHHTDGHFVTRAGVGGVVLLAAVATEDEI